MDFADNDQALVEPSSPLKKLKIVNGGKFKQNYKLVNTMGESNSTGCKVMCCRYEQGDKTVACGFADGAVRIYGVNSGLCTGTLGASIAKIKDYPVTALQWVPNKDNISKGKSSNNMLLTAQSDGSLKYWNPAHQKMIQHVQPIDENQIFCLDFNK